jgi:hypothetical protein
VDDRVKIVVTEKSARKELKLQRDGLDYPILVVGDSNLRKWGSAPDHWDVRCYPGLTLKEVCDMLCRSWQEIPDWVQHVCVVAGINISDGSEKTQKETVASMEALRQVAGESVVVVQTPIGDGLTEEHIAVVQYQNRQARRIFGDDHFIPVGAAPHRVVYRNNHYHQETAEYLIDKVDSFFQ